MGGAGVAEGLLEACRVEESRVEVHPDKFKRFHGQGKSLGRRTSIQGRTSK